MFAGEILFIGGNVAKFASVKIRCQELAAALGCDVAYMPTSAYAIPDKYRVYVLVKPGLQRADIDELAHRGKVVWDIVDDAPPSVDVDFVASSSRAASEFPGRRIHVVPHHHCNHEMQPNPPGRNAIWVGHSHWYPALENIRHERFFVDGMNREQVVQCYRAGGIAINYRCERPGSDRHIVLNSGIKVINSIGFGMPSVSPAEPAFMEYGDGCTIISKSGSCSDALARLCDDDVLYSEMRARCIETAPRFHINTVARQYLDLLNSL